MKLAFLVTRLDKPSARYRALQYIPFLQEMGFVPEVHVIPKGIWKRLALFRALRDYDIVFLQKKLLSGPEWSVLRRSSRRIVYDFDDAVMFRDSRRRRLLSTGRKRKFLRTVRNADMVIAGNRYLQDFSITENPRTFVIPTPLDMRRYTGKPPSSESRGLILGWIGGRATLVYLKGIRHALDSVFELHPNVKLKIVADEFMDCAKIPVIKKPWNYDQEIGDLHSFDVGLMPLTDDPWSRGKCGFKLLQYMAVGIPAVCSPVGVNREIVRDGVNGFWAGNQTEWMDKLGMLIRNPGLRSETGRRARETVSRDFSLESQSRRLAELLSKPFQ